MADIKVEAVVRDGDSRTTVTLSLDCPYNACIATLLMPGENLRLQRQGDELRGHILRDVPEQAKPHPSGRVVNTTRSILDSADRDG